MVFAFPCIVFIVLVFWLLCCVPASIHAIYQFKCTGYLGIKLMSKLEVKFMKQAIEAAAKSIAEDAGTHPFVGAVVVMGGKTVATAWRGKLGKGEHAEYTALEKILKEKGIREATGATVYTTLEPCTTRNHPKVPCAKWLIDHRVAKVVIGMLDPNQNICGRGVRLLRDAGVATEFFPSVLMAKVEAQNRHFTRAQTQVSECRICCGLSQVGTPYDFERFFKGKPKQVIIIGQNLTTMLNRPTFLPRIQSFLRNKVNVTVILTTPEFMSALGPAAYEHFKDSVTKLRDLCLMLNSAERKRLKVSFHAGASTLSAQIRDPDSPNGSLVFNPKWATDAEPENRMYCVIQKSEHLNLFTKLAGAVSLMTLKDSPSIKKMCDTVGIAWKRYKNEARH